jgi:SNF2 family DNA or RNA helicase
MSASADMTLEELVQGLKVIGLSSKGPVEVVSVTNSGKNAVTLVYRDSDGLIEERIILRNQISKLKAWDKSLMRAFDAEPVDWKLGAEAVRIKNVSSFDPMVALTTSDLDPLPHQLRAVYEELLPRSPLRFLLADDPGAGKTIMAGLYVKELILRSDAERVMIVVPGGLADQWQDELEEKFGLNFEILTREAINASRKTTLFSGKRLLIAKMDMLARDPDLIEQIRASSWDAVIIDEAHRMSAHFYGDEINRTKRYDLGLALGEAARHFLLMTATPHSGNPDSFNLFLSLLDADRFEGRLRNGENPASLDGMMRRLVKEDLLTMEGKALFPERRAYSLEFELSDSEQELYEVVTQYVRDQMIMAQQLGEEGDGRRKNNIGFALTILQRRLASSPAAILRSLERRRERILTSIASLAAVQQIGTEPEMQLQKVLADLSSQSMVDFDEFELDELDADQMERLEDDVVAAASLSLSEEALRLEVSQLEALILVAQKVKNSGSDKKWSELRKLLTSNDLVRDEDGSIRKIIIFTEHKDTLNYLETQIQGIVPDHSQIERIDGSTARKDRRTIQERFMNDPNSRILIATDAAGEGLNLQRSHLMVNYDLPWNPNRIEQRFGRIHRIGQTEVCHLWNLVAVSTREGQVFQRLLQKLEEMRAAYKGKVFDVLGEAFQEISLRDMLIEAVQYGDDPQRKIERDKVLDATVGDGIRELLEARALNAQFIDSNSVDEIRRAFEEAQARKLQPHYIKAFFIEAFSRLGGQIEARDDGRFEITSVPSAVIEKDRQSGVGAPVVDRYERVTFDRKLIQGNSDLRAQLIAPGHPLMSAVTDLIVEAASPLLRQGTVLVDENDPGEEPRLIVGVKSEIHNSIRFANGKQQVVDKIFEYLEISKSGKVHFGGPAPYLDYRACANGAIDFANVISDSWLVEGYEKLTEDWSVENRIPQRLFYVQTKVDEQVDRTKRLVHERLTSEINYWDALHDEILEDTSGRRRRISAATAFSRARMLEARLINRMAILEQESQLLPSKPLVSSCALVIPQGLIDKFQGSTSEAVATHAKNTEEVDRRAISKTVAAEKLLGRNPEVMPHNNPGWDIRSIKDGEPTIFIEVKGRIEGADTFTITRNEVLTAKNIGDPYRLVLVRVSTEGEDYDQIRYVSNPFSEHEAEAFLVCSYNMHWQDMWDRGQEPN